MTCGPQRRKYGTPKMQKVEKQERKNTRSIQASSPDAKSGVETASNFIDGGAAYVMWRSRPRDIAAIDVFHLRPLSRCKERRSLRLFSSLCCVLLITIDTVS